jgi:hypothetical protein
MQRKIRFSKETLRKHRHGYTATLRLGVCRWVYIALQSPSKTVGSSRHSGNLHVLTLPAEGIAIHRMYLVQGYTFEVPFALTTIVPTLLL